MNTLYITGGKLLFYENICPQVRNTVFRTVSLHFPRIISYNITNATLFGRLSSRLIFGRSVGWLVCSSVCYCFLYDIREVTLLCSWARSAYCWTMKRKLIYPHVNHRSLIVIWSNQGILQMIYVKDVSRLFYQKYEPKEVLGKGASSTVRHINHIGSKQQYVHF